MLEGGLGESCVVELVLSRFCLVLDDEMGLIVPSSWLDFAAASAARGCTSIEE